MADAASLPLFPLHTVLVPGAALDLRIFERRYLDMVRDCGRSGSGFGVCLILDGDEAGRPATPAAFGCEALIEDFGSTPEGLLSLRVRGRRRFHALRTRVRDSGLVVADIEWRDDDAPSPRLRPGVRTTDPAAGSGVGASPSPAASAARHCFRGRSASWDGAATARQISTTSSLSGCGTGGCVSRARSGYRRMWSSPTRP